MRVAASLAAVAVVALLLGGCGGSGDGETEAITATVPSSGLIQAKWEQSPDCDHPAGASRWGCSVGDYRCQAVVVDRGWSVSCARSGESVAFLVRR